MTELDERERNHPLGSIRDLAGNPPGYLAQDADAEMRFRATEAMRELNELVLTADADFDQFKATTEALESAVASLRTQPKRIPAPWENNMAIGLLNVLTPVVRHDPVPDDPSIFRCRATFDVAQEGFPGVVHGGLLSFVFDHACGVVCALVGIPAMTGTLSVRYERPAPLRTELTIVTRVDRVEGRKVFVTGEVSADGEVCARVEALMIQPRGLA